MTNPATGDREPMKLNRAVTKQECPWLDADLAEGTKVFRYTGCTYGCIGPGGIAISLEENGPFAEVPRAALSLAGERP